MARILIVDDEQRLHTAYRKILCAKNTLSHLDNEALDLFALEPPSTADKESTSHRLDSAFYGEEALDKVSDALREDKPYSMVFMDIRMPPGMDGIEASQQLWQIDPCLHIAICTAFADYSAEEIRRELRDHRDQFLILKKPFIPIVIETVATMLTSSNTLKFSLEQQLKKKSQEAEEFRQRLEAVQELSDFTDQVNNDLFSHLHHELRTALYAVLGYTEILLQDRVLTEDQQQMLDTVFNRSSYLLGLVRDMIDPTKARTEKLELKSWEPTDEPIE